MRNSLTAHACLLCFIRSCGVGLTTICRRLDLYQACDCGGQKKILGKNKISLSHQRQHSFTASVFLVPASHSIKGDSGVLIARQII